MLTSDEDEVRRLAAFLRQVDGVSHLAIGPLGLVTRTQVAGVLGVPRGRLTGFLVAFIAYGHLVVLRSRSEDPRSLFIVAACGNVAFVACVACSLAVHDLTTCARLAHLGSAASAAFVGARAARGLSLLRDT